MNILITGAEGQLGQCFKNVVVKNSIQNQHNYYFTDKLSVDITKYEDIETYVKINNINITEIFDFKLVPKKLIRYTTTNTIADTCIDKAR